MSKLTETMITLIETLTFCGVRDEGEYYTIYVDNSAGEDFSFDVNKGDNEVEEIISYCKDFDASEHFKLWYGADRGEPSDPRDLMDNCDQIAERLIELKNLLEDYDFETFDKIKEDNPNLTDDEINEIVEQGYSEVCAIYKDKQEMAYEEARAWLGINEQAENYFKFDEFGDDLLASDKYLKLSSGRIVAVE